VQISVKNMAGDVVDQIEIRDDVFGVTVNEGLLHQAVLRQLANLRQGTASTKTRGQVHGTTKKMYRQKGTGQARQGTRKAPHWRGGGVVFGPHPRDYRQDMPKKQRRVALRSALTSKVGEDRLLILDELRVDQPRTKEIVAMLKSLGIDHRALLVLPDGDQNVVLSARNVPGVETMPAYTLNTLAVMRHEYVVMPVAALRKVEEILATSNDLDPDAVGAMGDNESAQAQVAEGAAE
jgi:large subunit ribosomal protein L4